VHNKNADTLKCTNISAVQFNFLFFPPSLPPQLYLKSGKGENRAITFCRKLPSWFHIYSLY